MSFREVQDLCASREVDLVLKPGVAPSELRLHAEFDGYGDFFTIDCVDVEYADIAGGVTVGAVEYFEDASAAASLAAKWAPLTRLYSGHALVITGADAVSTKDAEPQHLFLVIAGRFDIVAGSDARAP